MANRFRKVGVDGGDLGVWAPIEEDINMLGLGTITAYLYDDTGALKLAKGRIGLDDGSQKGAVIVDTVVTLSLVGLTASCWAKVEVSRTGTVPTIAIASIAGSTNPATLPASFTGAYDGDKQGFYIVGTKRVAGLAWINAAGALEGIINCLPGNSYAGYSTSDDTHDAVRIFNTNKLDVYPLNNQRLTYTKNASWTVETFAGTSFANRTREATFYCTAGTNGIRGTIPAAGWKAGDRLTFIKVDDTNSAVTLTGVTINGLTYVFLIEQWQKITIEYNGTNFYIVQGTLIADTGWVNRSDWTDVHIGTSTVVYDGKVGTFLLGELVKEATSNNTGIIVADSGTALTLWRCTGTGIFTNDRVLTGQISLATANVNNASTDKNTDYNFYHGFGKTSATLSVTGMTSSDKAEANIIQIYPCYMLGAGGDYACVLKGIDTNNIQIQTATNGTLWINGAALTYLDTEDWYYRFIVKLVI